MWQQSVPTLLFHNPCLLRCCFNTAPQLGFILLFRGLRRPSKLLGNSKLSSVTYLEGLVRRVGSGSKLTEVIAVFSLLLSFCFDARSLGSPSTIYLLHKFLRRIEYLVWL